MCCTQTAVLPCVAPKPPCCRGLHPNRRAAVGCTQTDRLFSSYGRANSSISAMRPPCYYLLEEIVILGVIYGSLVWRVCNHAGHPCPEPCMGPCSRVLLHTTKTGKEDQRQCSLAPSVCSSTTFLSYLAPDGRALLHHDIVRWWWWWWWGGQTGANICGLRYQQLRFDVVCIPAPAGAGAKQSRNRDKSFSRLTSIHCMYAWGCRPSIAATSLLHKHSGRWCDAHMQTTKR